MADDTGNPLDTQLAQAGGRTVVVDFAAAGERAVEVQPGDRVDVEANPDDVQVVRDGDDVILSVQQPDGSVSSVRLVGFASASDSAQPPQIVVGGNVIAGDVLLSSAQGIEDIAADGPETPQDGPVAADGGPSSGGVGGYVATLQDVLAIAPAPAGGTARERGDGPSPGPGEGAGRGLGPPEDDDGLGVGDPGGGDGPGDGGPGDGVDSTPDAEGEQVILSEDSEIVVDVLANDTDNAPAALQVAIAEGPSNGTATVLSTGEIRYIPNADFNGSDSLTYTVSDPAGNSDTATVAFTVTPVNDAPVASDDSFTLPEGLSYQLSTAQLLANDSDVDGDPLSISGVSGDATLNGDGTISFGPLGSEGTTFSYTVADGNGGTATGQLTITAGEPGDLVAVDVVGVPAGEIVLFETDADGQPISVKGRFHEIQAAIDAADASDKVRLGAGTFTLSSQLNVDESVTIEGAGEGNTTIETAGTNWGIYVTANDVALQDLSVDAAATTLFGVKVAPDSADPTASLTGFSITDVTVLGAGQSEIDFNGVDDSALTRVTADGQDTGGVGIALSDSTGITLTDIETTGNNWGSIGLFSAGRSFQAGTNDITFEGTYTHTETVGVYADEDDGTAGDPQSDGVQNIDLTPLVDSEGVIYKVENSAFRAGTSDAGQFGRSDDFVFFFGNKADAVAYATGLTDGNGNDVSDQSIITLDETPADVDAERGETFFVGAGMSIQTAIDAASAGDTILLADNTTFREQVEIDGKTGLTILGGANTRVEMPDDPALVNDTTGSGKSRAAVISAEDSSDITVEGLTIDARGLAGDVPTTSGASDINGIYFANTSGSLTGNTILGARDELNADGSVSGTQRGVGLLALNEDSAARSLDIANNVVEGFQKNGITVYGAGLTAAIDGNIVTGNGFIDRGNAQGQNGIQLSSGADGSITNNTVTDIGRAGDDWASSYIVVFGTGDGVEVTGNTLEGVAEVGNTVGVYVYGTDDASVDGNGLSNLLYGVIFAGNVDNPNETGNSYTNVGGTFVGKDEGTIGDPGDTLNGVTVYLSAGDNDSAVTTFSPSDSNDTLVGSPFDDTLDGLDGSDTLKGGSGNDTLNGGAGTDTAVIADGGGSAVAMDDFTFAKESVAGDAYAGEITFGSDTDTLSGIEVIKVANTDGDGNATFLVRNGMSLDAAAEAAGDNDTILLQDGGTVHVVEDGGSIQAAIDAAAAGDTILVGPGTYTENIEINKDVSLLSTEGRDSTTIQGNEANGGLGTIQITPNTSAVQIGDTGQGFKIVGFDSSNPGLEKAGIYFQGNHSGAVVRGNEIEADGDAGLLTEYSADVNNVVIEGNVFSGKTFVGDNPAGDGFGQQFTLHNVPRQLVVLSQGGSNNTFHNNEVTGTAGGINSDGDEQGNTLVTIDSPNSTISDNVITGTTARYGVGMRARGEDTDITGNEIKLSGGNSSFYLESTDSDDVFLDNVLVGNDDDGWLAGTPGDDEITGGGANELFIGGEGDDLLDFSGGGQDLAQYTVGTDGNDTLEFFTLDSDGTAANGLTGADADQVQFSGASLPTVDSVQLTNNDADNQGSGEVDVTVSFQGGGSLTFADLLSESDNVDSLFDEPGTTIDKSDGSTNGDAVVENGETITITNVSNSDLESLFGDSYTTAPVS